MRSRRPDGDTGVIEEQAGSVVTQLALESERRSRVVVTLAAAVVPEAHIPLLEPIHAQVDRADVRRRRIRLLAHLQREAMDRQRIRESRRLEVDVDAAVEVRRRLAVDPPSPFSVGLKRPLVVT